MNREEIEFNNKKYIKEVTLYFNDKNKNDFVNDVDYCLERNEIEAEVLFISLIETARDVCRVINADFKDYLRKCIELGSVDDYFEDSDVDE